MSATSSCTRRFLIGTITVERKKAAFVIGAFLDASIDRASLGSLHQTFGINEVGATSKKSVAVTKKRRISSSAVLFLCEQRTTKRVVFVFWLVVNKPFVRRPPEDQKALERTNKHPEHGARANGSKNGRSLAFVPDKQATTSRIYFRVLQQTGTKDRLDVPVGGRSNGRPRL